MSWFSDLFGKHTKDDAKQRLEVMLIHDRGLFDNADLEQMEKEILAVVKRYADIETGAAEINADRLENGRLLLSIRVPVSGQKTRR
ncbi:cell division topological specificity factor MinE [Coprothermobacter platensis]|jgi:cell division topological specificity factor|uniref:cell division topological specificity factor MinE n=1 Tax=Coprothermobacter platensis TaxID=108819 RepID=UPI00037DF882|nr:cell division topological specificity factor MinE [Coprothermobacter platensis]